MNPPTFLLISVNSGIRQLLEEIAPPRTTVLTAPTIPEGLRLWKQATPSLLLCQGTPQLINPILEYGRQFHPSTPIVAVGERQSVKDAVDVMRAGASDYLTPPIQPGDLKAAIDRVIQHRGQTLHRDPSGDPFGQIISISPQMILIKQLAREVAGTDATVLITGESGTGKELFAQAIHAASPRASGPLIALNCAGIPENLLEAELFGYQRGAFTDAKQTKPGRFQLAEGGTLFLDEIGEMSSAAQAKLLRVLEDRTVDPLGATQSHKVNIRVVAATNEDLLLQIKGGRFRLDLYYRLNVYQLRIPPLRERPDDIEPIFHSFLERARLERGCRIKGAAPDALALLRRHDWPGNVRELHNLAEWLTITCKDDVVHSHHLPGSVLTHVASGPAVAQTRPSLLAFGLSFQDMEKRILEEALHKAGGNVSEASRLLRLTRNTLRYRMAKYHLS
jgi:DNA-binding NtrC family response regulator